MVPSVCQAWDRPGLHTCNRFLQHDRDGITYRYHNVHSCVPQQPGHPGYDLERNEILFKLRKIDELYDIIIIDTGAGISKNVISFSSS